MPRLASFLRDEIQRRDWSVEDLAKRAGISTSLAYQIVRDGKDNVRRDTLIKLASALKMTPSEIFEATDDADDRELATRQAQFGAALRGIPREFWGAVLKASVSLAESLPTSGVTARESTSVSSPDRATNKRADGQTPELPGVKHPFLLRSLAGVTG